jgi:hypothetical protein
VPRFVNSYCSFFHTREQYSQILLVLTFETIFFEGALCLLIRQPRLMDVPCGVDSLNWDLADLVQPEKFEAQLEVYLQTSPRHWTHFF